jgi:hypothetical protein
MPNPMRVKIFMGRQAEEVESQINDWLHNLGSPAVIKTETTVAAIAEKPGDGARPCIVVTVWYEPRESN